VLFHLERVPFRLERVLFHLERAPFHLARVKPRQANPVKTDLAL
jgi:hypothetical protein